MSLPRRPPPGPSNRASKKRTPFVEISGGVRIFHRDEGRGRALPILFLHGFTGSSWYWRGQMSHFAKSRRAVTLDWKGHGESDKPVDALYSVEQYCRELDEICGKIGLKEAIVCGHSMGGMVAQLYALDWAKTGKLAVRALVLVATAPRLALPPLMIKGYEMLVTYKDQWSRAARLKLAETAFHPDFAAAHPEVVEEGFRWTDIVPVPIRLGLFRALVGEFDLRERVSAIRVPALVLVGESDTMLPGAYGLGHRIPDARIITYPETGHMVPVEREAEMNRDVEEFARSLP